LDKKKDCDMSKLEPRIEAIRKEYGLNAEDFWQIPQNKQWVCKHAALEIVAVKASINFDPPMIIEADASGLVTSMVVTGHMGERSEWATGETNPTNYSVRGKQPSYPWAMSEKRAKDRVILKLVGIHGLVYSEAEAEGLTGSAEPVSAAEIKRKLAEIDQDLLDCQTPADIKKCGAIWKAIFERDQWSGDYIKVARERFDDRLAGIKRAMNGEDRNEYLENMSAG
jgi:hypothetical protein